MRVILAGAGPGLLDRKSIDLMRDNVTIGVNTTVRYSEVKPLLDYWIGCDGRLITPVNPHDIREYLKDGEFDKYILWARQWEEYGKDIHRLKWFKNSLQAPMGGYSGNPLTLGFNNTVMTSASDLAKHLGATECILVGSDYMGARKADGTITDDNMSVAMKYAQDFFKNLDIPVYKTNPQSPIKLEVYGSR